MIETLKPQQSSPPNSVPPDWATVPEPAAKLVALLVVLPPPHAFVASTFTSKVPLAVGVPDTVMVSPDSADADRPAGKPDTVALVAFPTLIVPLNGTPWVRDMDMVYSLLIGECSDCG